MTYEYETRSPTSTVLHVSPDSALAESRTNALTKIGCQVVNVETVSSAVFEINLGRCGILLLCHKLHAEGRSYLAEYFRKNCPDPFIIAVLAHERDHYPPKAHAKVVYARDHRPLVALLRQRLASA
jgi:hypothetical protein